MSDPPPGAESGVPRIQRIAALIAVTVVVVVTLVSVSLAGDGSDSAATDGLVDPVASPTAVPVLERERSTWEAARDGFVGAAGTNAPVPCPFVDEREREPNNFLSMTPGLTFICDVRGLSATPIAAGHVVAAVSQPLLNSQKAEIVANGKDGPWVRAAAYGSFVVIDHGPLGGIANLTSVYAGLDSIDPELRVGQPVDTTTRLGMLGARDINGQLVAGTLTFELLANDTRFGADPLRSDPPPASAAAGLAAQLASVIDMPLKTCTLPFGNPDLNVGAPRTYRSGTHNGLDFNCGTNDHEIVAAADGEVLFVLDDFVDPTTENRDAVLGYAALAGDTPFWSLAMLYGRFVVIAHHLPDFDDQVVTIYAHMSEIDDNIVTGRIVEAGTALGFVGNTGTSTAAAGITDAHSSVHLHWELHVADRAVGYLGDPVVNEGLYRQMLCDTAAC